MNEQNLKPLNTRTKKEQREIARLGGKANKNNPNSIRAAKLREIKKRVKKGQLKTKDEEWLLERLESRDAFSLDIISYLDEIKSSVHPSQRIALANAYATALKTQHGDKHINQNLNVNIDVDVKIEEMEKHIRKVIGKVEK